MNKKSLFKIQILFLVSCTFSPAIAQWELNGNSATDPATEFVGTTDNFGLVFRTNNQERFRISAAGSFGFGTNNPLSLLHLNTTTTGNLFRTDGPAGSLNQWQLFTGGTEKFRIYVPASTNNTYFQNKSTNSNALMGFMTGNLTRMQIYSGNTTGGNITMGDSLYPTFIPIDRLNLYHKDSSTTAIRFGHGGTGNSGLDGTRIGILQSGDFNIRQ